MNRIRVVYLNMKLLSIALLSLFFAVSLFAEQPPQGSLGVAYDCTGVEIAEVDPAMLTKAEQIKLMENALLDSVNRYSTCLEKVQKDMTQSQSQGANLRGDNAQNSQESDANANLQNASSTEQNSQTPLSTMDDQVTTEKEKNKAGGGREQQIVKPKDNDSIICTMLYEEIQKETNEATREALVQQYKDYNCTK